MIYFIKFLYKTFILPPGIIIFFMIFYAIYLYKKSDIITDDKSLNTEENALNTAKILRQKGFVKPILVTSAFHMRRSVLFFKKNNIKVIPYPCDYRVNINKYITLDDFIPNSDAMNNLSITVKEYVGAIAAWK